MRINLIFILALLNSFSLLHSQSYCTSGASFNGDTNIETVIFNTINNSSTQCATYTDNTAMITNVTAGSLHNLTVRASTCGWDYDKAGKVYIDYNRDFDFNDPGEEIFSFGPTYSPQTYNSPITIPMAIVPGFTVMRVVVIETNLVSGVSSCGSYSYGETEDYGINLLPSVPNDMGASAVINPVSGCGMGASEIITATFWNFGQNSQTGVDVSYSINGNPPVTENLGILPMASGSSIDFSFASPSDFSTPGTYTIDVWTSLAGDAFSGNDTFSTTVVAVPSITTFPYVQDFESGQGGWLSSGGSWAFGTPGKSVINGAASGANSWVTGGLGTGFYQNNEQSAVVGPCFDFSVLQNPWISMSIWWESESGWDGAVLQSSVDFGLSWENVGSTGEPFNWFNESSILGNPGMDPNGSNVGWSGSPGSGGWVTAAHQLTGLQGQPSVLLRVAFGSDGSFNMDGFGFDDVFIGEGPTPEIGPDQFMCTGDSIFFSADQVYNSYSWTGGGTGQTETYTSPGQVVLSVTNSLGFFGTDTAFIDFSFPNAQLGVDTTICPEDSLLLSVSNPGGSFLWHNQSVDSSFLVTGPGTYTVAITDTVGCTVSDTIIVEEYAYIPVNLGDDTIICIGDPAIFDAGSVIPGSEYLWGSGQTTQQVLVTAPGEYSVEVTYPGGCTSSDTVLLDILPTPFVNLGNDRAGCNFVVLDAMNAGAQFIWSNGSTSQSITVFNTDDYSVTVTNNMGCTSVDTVTITMVPPPQPSLVPEVILCRNETVTLEPGNFGPNSTYFWSTGAIDPTLTVNSPGVYVVQINDSNGCLGLDTTTVIMSSLMVDLGPDIEVCEGTEIILDSQVEDVLYEWSTSDTTQSILVLDSGTYSVSVTDGFGCTETDEIHFSSLSGVVAEFDLPQTDTLFLPTPFMDMSSPTPNAWYWDFGDGDTSMVQNPTHTYLAFGGYTVTLIVEYGPCRDTISHNLVINEYVGVEEEKELEGMRFYPNPTSGEFIAELEFTKATSLSFEVYDVNGKLILIQETPNALTYSTKFDLSTHPNGIYLVKISTPSKTYFEKIQKRSF